MTTTMARPKRLNPADVAQYVMLAFIVVSSLGGAFTHMHDWTSEALPKQADWLCWSNAVISELLPTSAFLSMRTRQRQGRSARLPGWIFFGSGVLSLTAQLSATGVRLLFDTQLLACLPAIALMILSKLIFSDVEYARKQREEADADAARRAERDAERARKVAEEAAERRRRAAEEAAERAAEEARKVAEAAAEADRRQRADEAAAAERVARIEAEAMTRRHEIEAAERAAERAARVQLEQAAADREARRLDEAARIEAEARAEAVRVEAEARAGRERAEAARIEAAAAAQREAAALVSSRVTERGRGSAGLHAAPDGAEGGSSGKRRRTREESEEITAATLAVLPAGTSRDEAVRVVAAALDCTERNARNFVPTDWAGEPSAEDSAQRRRLSVVG